MSILALNAGSTSLKFRFGAADGSILFEGEAQRLREPSPLLEIRDAAGAVISRQTPQSLVEAARAVLAFAKDRGSVTAVGHRFVHGGPDLVAHKKIDRATRAALEVGRSFAPLHNPPALDVLALAEAAFPGLPQIACLDTAFHADMPETAKRLPLPVDRLGPGVRRYGFHGLSCESILQQLATPPARLVIAHLGGGASVTAVRDGRSIDTTMGLTPDGGVMMETRSGDLDPGLLIYLLRRGETATTLEALLNDKSGIAGISGSRGDVREVRDANTEQGRLALEMFSISVAKAVASMATALSGLELLVFTGGIGIHDEAMRESIIARLRWMPDFASKAMPAQEERVIIQHARALM
jgi:acetate kinase